jgi:hypothetical protein
MRSSLLVGAALPSFMVAGLHLWIIAVGAPAYRYTGAGQTMVRLAEAGSPIPALVTSGAAVLFVLAGLYPLSVAGWIPRLPLATAALVCIAAVYTLRGLVLISQLSDTRLPTRELVFSATSLSIGLLYIVATVAYWRASR